MRNEARAFAYQPEDEEPAVAPVEATEKKSAVILQFPNKKIGEFLKTEIGNANGLTSNERNISVKDIEECHSLEKKERIATELHETMRVLKSVEMETFNFINDELLGIYFWEFDRSLEHDFYVDFIDEKLTETFEDDFNRTVDTKRRDGIENETQGKTKYLELLTYEELWKKYNIDQSAIIDKYIEFVDNHLNGVKQHIAVDDLEKQATFVKKFEKWQSRKGEITKWRNDVLNKENELSKIENSELAMKVSAKYQEIIMLADNLIEKVKSRFQSEKDFSPEDIHNLRYALLHRAENVYALFIEKIKNDATSNHESVSLEIEKIKQETIFFTNLFKTFAKENSDISFEDFKGLSFETATGKDLESEQDISQMVLIAQKNYAANIEMQKLVVESLQEGLQNESSQFYILKHNGEIVAFCRFDDEGNHFYAGSFNVDPDYRGSAIGEVMMRESLDKKAQEKPVHAITDPEKIICSKYIEDEGFVIDEILRTEVEGKTLTEANIVRDDKKNKAYEYRVRYRPEDLIHAYERQEQELKMGDRSRSQILKNKKPFLLKFDKDLEMEKFLNLSEKLMQEYSYVISRYLPVDKTGKKMLAAFEHKL